MKRMLLILLTLLLSTACALAESIAHQVNAPPSVQDMFSSRTGRTVIDIDAVVHVPDAEHIYLIPVESTFFHDDMVLQLAALIWPTLNDEKIIIDDTTSTESHEGSAVKHRYFRHSAQLDQLGTKQEDIDVQIGTSYYRYTSFDQALGASLTASVSYDRRYRQHPTINYNNPYMMQEVQGTGIEGHPLNSREAAAIGSQLLSSLTGEAFSLFAVGQSDGIIYDDKLLKEGLAHKNTGYSYALTYTRIIDGVALLPCQGALMNTSTFRDDLYVPPVGYEQILMALNREGQVTSLIWSSPYIIGEDRIEQTLLPFENILSIARQTMPLKYQVEEVRNNIHYHVHRIDLGYMATLQRDSLTFALTPVWCFYGQEVPANPHIGIQPLLAINAVDGMVIDLVYGY